MGAKIIRTLLIGGLTLFFSGCGTSYIPATSKSAYDKTIKKIETELNEKGYHLSGVENKIENRIAVRGTSVSAQSGYGTLFGNNYVYIDNFIFTNDNSESVEFGVSYNFFYNKIDSTLTIYTYDTVRWTSLSGESKFDVYEKTKKEQLYDYQLINVSIPHCKTSKYEDFEKICGDSAIVSQILKMPKDRRMKR